MVDRCSVVGNHSMVGKLCSVVPFLNRLWMFHGIAKLLDGNFVIEARMKHTVIREAGCDAGKDGKDGGAQMHSHRRSRDRWTGG